MPAIGQHLRRTWILTLLGLACHQDAQAQATRPTIPAAPASQPASEVLPSSRPAEDFWTRSGLTGDWAGARQALEDAGFEVELYYVHQFQQLFRGGLDTHNGQRFAGSYDLGLEADLEALKLIPGASFYIKGRGNHGEGINPHKVGALHDVNSDALFDYPIYVRKWWYRQDFADGKLEFRLGRIQTHKDLFDVSLYANHEDRDFLNRLSSRNTVIPHRNAIGAFARARPVENLYLQAAVIDAQAEIRTKTGFDTAFHDEDLFITYWEVGLTPAWKTRRGDMPGRYRFGGWYDPTLRRVFEEPVGRRREPDWHGGNEGYYIGVDQMIWRENSRPADSQGLGFFGRLGDTHRDVNRTYLYWQAGLSYQGLLPAQDADVFGFSVSQAVVSDRFRHAEQLSASRETVYEWFYSYHLTPWCIISPDFQVVTNPGGTTDRRDAIVGGIRIQVLF